MTIEEYKTFTARGEHIEAGGDKHLLMHSAAQEAMKAAAKDRTSQFHLLYF